MARQLGQLHFFLIAIVLLNECILYLQKAYTCYSNQTDIYTCNTMTTSREQLNTLYIDNNIN